ncbi:hypothetical protein OC846_006649, partial [Tilletia horrida]
HGRQVPQPDHPPRRAVSGHLPVHQVDTCRRGRGLPLASMEHSALLPRLGLGDPNGQAPAPPLVQATRHHLRPCVLTLLILLCSDENLLPLHPPRDRLGNPCRHRCRQRGM